MVNNIDFELFGILLNVSWQLYRCKPIVPIRWNHKNPTLAMQLMDQIKAIAIVKWSGEANSSLFSGNYLHIWKMVVFGFFFSISSTLHRINTAEMGYSHVLTKKNPFHDCLWLIWNYVLPQERENQLFLQWNSICVSQLRLSELSFGFIFIIIIILIQPTTSVSACLQISELFYK